MVPTVTTDRRWYSVSLDEDLSNISRDPILVSGPTMNGKERRKYSQYHESTEMATTNPNAFHHSPFARIAMDLQDVNYPPLVS